jgi:hypothetical protein
MRMITPLENRYGRSNRWTGMACSGTPARKARTEDDREGVEDRDVDCAQG